MIKWFTSTLAFLLLLASLTALTSSVFLNSAIDNFGLAETAFKNKSSVFVDENFDLFKSQLTSEQKEQFEQLNSLTVEQRKLLTPQCAEEKNAEAPFCHPKFISGEFTLDQAIKATISEQVDVTQFDALKSLRDKLKSFANYNLMLIAILSGIVSLILYLLLKGILPGMQIFFGNVAWLSLLSVFSFKLTPYFMNQLLLVAKQPGATDAMSSVLKEIASAWLVPSMNAAFILSAWLTAIAFVIWAILKLIRNYDVQVT